MARNKKTVEEEVLPVEENVIETVEETVENEVIEEEVKEVVDEPQEEEKLDPEKVIEEFTDAAKKIDEFVTKDTTPEELTAKLEDELAHAEEIESRLEKQIADLQKKTTKASQESFSKFWMGI